MAKSGLGGVLGGVGADALAGRSGVGGDAKRNVLVYMVYSDRLIEGSPKNSTSSVPIMPWGAADAAVQKCGEFIQ